MALSGGGPAVSGAEPPGGPEEAGTAGSPGRQLPDPFPEPRTPGRSEVPPVQVSPAQGTPPTGPITVPTPLPGEVVNGSGDLGRTGPGGPLTPWPAEPSGSAGRGSGLQHSTPATGRDAYVDNQHDRPEPAGPSLVRPYARTGGRTRPGRDLDLEALVLATSSGREAWSSPLLNPEHTSVIELCSGTVSVAEIAARLSLPLGVARVIIADMVDLGLVEVMKTSATNGDERDPAFLRRVLSGLQRL
jgi:hypothetical protein